MSNRTGFRSQTLRRVFRMGMESGREPRRGRGAGRAALERRLLAERLGSRELLAADFGVENEVVFAAVEPAATKLFVAKSKELAYASQQQGEVSHDHWLMSWSAEEGPAESYGPSVVVSVERAPLISNAYLVRFQQPFSATDAYGQLGFGAEPSLLYPLVPRQQALRYIPNDEIFIDQWHLLNTGQVADAIPGEDMNVVGAWDQYLGRDVVIAIVDDGVQYTHEDLTDRYRPDLSFDFFDNDPDPAARPTTDRHGTAVAGVALATQDNVEGVSGVAPMAEMAALRLVVGETTDLQEATALKYRLDEIDIYNNSWGPPDLASPFDFVLFANQPGPLALAAIEDGVTSGRGGLGSVYVWAGGNGGRFGDNVNYDLYANSRYTIAVGAVGPDGIRAPYSEPGASLLLVSPSENDRLGVWTTDILDLEGYGPTDYTNLFGGTSAAAPGVAGVVALMLEANPNLTYRDVQHILIHTARQNDPTEADWVQNGAGLWVNHNYGFGVVDATAAVDLAEQWTSISAEQSWQSPVLNPRVLIPDNDPVGVDITFDIRENFPIEYIELKTRTQHTWAGDLVYKLTSPSGTVSVLTDVHNRTENHTFNFPVTSARHWDEYTFGTWTLNISDQFAADEGTVEQIQLTIYGNEGNLAQPLLEISDTSAREDNRTLDFLVSIPAPVDYDITFQATTVAETATPGEDYEELFYQSYIIPAGQTSTFVTVVINDDTVAEEDETFLVALSQPSGARVPRVPVVGTIIDDDGPKIIDAQPWELIGPKASMVRRSLGNEFSLESSEDLAFLIFPAAEGMRLSMQAESSSPDATMSVEVLDELGQVVGGPVAAIGPGAPLLLDNFLIPSSGVYSLLFYADQATDVSIDLYANASIEKFLGDTVAGNALDFSSSLMDFSSGRMAVVGSLVDQPVEYRYELDQSALFYDISGSGIPLDLGDDEVITRTSSIGNKFLPAGPVRISDNGIVVAGDLGTPSYLNSPLPRTNFQTLLAPYWDDLIVGGGFGNIYWDEGIFDGQSMLIIQWEGRPHFNVPFGDSSFQLQVIEGSPSMVRFAYRDVIFGSPAIDGGRSATIGVQIKPEAGQYFQHSHNQLNAVQDGSIIEFMTPDDVDFYSFDLTGYVGREVDLVLAGIDATDLSLSSMELIGPDGSVIASGMPDPGFVTPTEYQLGIANFQVLDPGIYQVRVTAQGTGDYMLLVTAGGVFDTEDNNDPAQTLRKLALNTGAVGHVAAADTAEPDEVDYYEIDLSADERIILQTVTPFDTGVEPMSNSLDPMISIYDGKSGALIGSNDNSAIDGRNAVFRFIAPEDGTYIVGISAVSGVGQYFLSSTEWVNNPPTSILLSPDTIGENSPTAAAPFLVGNLFAADDDLLDQHSFDLVAGTLPNDNAFFSIVGNELYVNQGVLLDYETKPSYSIRVRATDDYGDSFVRNLTVFLQERLEVEEVRINDGSAQRSRVESLEVTFEREVAIDADAITVNRRGAAGGPVQVSFTTRLDGSGRTIASLAFAGPFVEFGSLVDGNYELVIEGDKVRDTGGAILDGDRNGVPGGDYLFGAEAADRFFRFFGDLDGNRSVGLGEMATFRASFGTAQGDARYVAPLDYDAGGRINLLDMVEFRRRYGLSLGFE